MYILNSCCNPENQPIANEQAKTNMLVSHLQAPKRLMNTIAETARLCCERDMGPNDNTLRYLCRNGMLPCVKVGKKTLINWNTLVNFLFSEELSVPDESKTSRKPDNGIRKIPTRITK